MMRLPGGGRGSYYLHHRMDGAVHSFIRLPPRLAAETTTIAASTGRPAGSPPRLCACRQARAAARDNDEEDEDDCVQRAAKVLAAGNTRAYKLRQRPTAGDTIIDDCWTADNNKEGSRQEQKNNQPLRVEGG